MVSRVDHLVFRTKFAVVQDDPAFGAKWREEYDRSGSACAHQTCKHRATCGYGRRIKEVVVAQLTHATVQDLTSSGNVHRLTLSDGSKRLCLQVPQRVAPWFMSTATPL